MSNVATACELVFAKQFEELRQNASLHGWSLELVGQDGFILDLPTKDGSNFSLLTKCNEYPEMPPAWHWYNKQTKAIDSPGDTPTGGTFFHGNGVICAPWNRLAYKHIDARGPHSDWTIGNWLSAKETAGTQTLAAMADRIAHEFLTAYQKRLA